MENKQKREKKKEKKRKGKGSNQNKTKHGAAQRCAENGKNGGMNKLVAFKGETSVVICWDNESMLSELMADGVLLSN